MDKLNAEAAKDSSTDKRTHISIGKFQLSDLTDYVQLSKLEFQKNGLIEPSHEDWKDSYVESLLTNPDHIRWKHLHSPFGVSTFVRLATSAKTVGRVVLQPRPFYTASQKLDVAFDTDMMVNREFRSPPSNFIKLIKASDKVSDFDFVYHTANEVTHQLYGRLLRFPNPFSLQSYGLPLRIAGLLSTLFGRRINALDWLIEPFRWLLEAAALVFCWAVGPVISQQSMSDTELDELFTKCLHQSGPLLARTNEYLRWRFGEEADLPGKVWRIDRKGRLVGYFVTRQVKLGALKHFVLMDFLLDTDISLLSCFALRLWLICMAIRSKADTLFTMINPFNRLASKCIGFPIAHIPDSLLPHATPIFIRANGLQNRHFETDKSIHITLADMDYF